MKRGGGLAGLAALSLLLLGGAPDARAALVKGAAFTIDIRGANVRFISPVALRGPEHPPSSTS